MLEWALIFFIVSPIAGVFGSAGMASGAAAAANMPSFIAAALLLPLPCSGRRRQKLSNRPNPPVVSVGHVLHQCKRSPMDSPSWAFRLYLW